MSDTGVSFWMRPFWSGAPMHSVRLAAVALAIGLVAAAGAARAQDDEDDDKTFEEKMVEGIMAGVGATNMENRGIDYRERSPLVVPPRLDLPPPVTATKDVKDANWPKDPDEARRKAAIAQRKKTKPVDPIQAARPLTPSELEVGRSAAPTRASNEPIEPGVSVNPILSPSQLGFDGRFSSLFGGNKTESKQFTSEPSRESLTQPPPGYQTPSPNFMYGTGPRESLYKPYDPASGKPRE